MSVAKSAGIGLDVGVAGRQQTAFDNALQKNQPDPGVKTYFVEEFARLSLDKFNKVPGAETQLADLISEFGSKWVSEGLALARKMKTQQS